nr:hypothetical protein [Acholeplasmatales bacterium]
DRTFIYSFTMLIITLLFIFIPDMWNIVIKPFYVIQFPFRLFFLVGMYFTLMVGSILKYCKNDKIVVSLTFISTSFMIVMTQANLEKRIEANKENPSFAYKITEKDLTGNKHEIGFNFEYMPQCFYPGDSHEKSYDNSLFYSVRNIIHNDYYGNNAVNTLEPAFLEGSGTISNYYSKAPKITFDVEVTSDSYIQVPLIYYPGYEITVINQDNNKEKEVEAKEVDGLVSFKLKEGNYKIKFNYKGTTIRKLSYAYFMLSIVGLMAFYQLYFYIIIYKKNKDNNIFTQ